MSSGSSGYSNYSYINQKPVYKTNSGIVDNTMSNFSQVSNTNTGSDYYKMYQQPQKEENYDKARYATKSLFEKNHITQVFFSDDNIKRIQKKIKEQIFLRTKGQYTLDEEQDESDLIVAMRAVYLDKCKNLPGETIRQVKLLNEQTVNYVVPDMISNIKQYFGYIKDINQPLVPMMRPMNVNNAGRNLLPSITTVWR